MEICRVDHTYEVENRIKAIRILPDDSCIFFQQRYGSIMAFHFCQYCQYAKFDADCEDENLSGFCRFKR